MKQELDLANRLMSETTSLEQLAEQIGKYGEAFPGIKMFTEAALIIPSSMATVENSFSHLKALLRPQRLSMGQERKSDLVLLAYNKDILRALDLDQLVIEFAKCSRKLLLL